MIMKKKLTIIIIIIMIIMIIITKIMTTIMITIIIIKVKKKHKNIKPLKFSFHYLDLEALLQKLKSNQEVLVNLKEVRTHVPVLPLFYLLYIVFNMFLLHYFILVDCKIS